MLNLINMITKQKYILLIYITKLNDLIFLRIQPNKIY